VVVAKSIAENEPPDQVGALPVVVASQSVPDAGFSY
jgi:hypothetical protein